MNDTVQCSNCKSFYIKEAPDEKERNKCPDCGKICRVLYMDVSNDLGIYDQLGTKQKRPGKKKPINEQISGYELTRATNTYSIKSRVIDRENDYYFEEIIDPETGEVLHHREEKLSEHYGRGSAKFQKHDFQHADIAIAAYYIWEKECRPENRDKEHWNMAIEDMKRDAAGIPRIYT